MTKTPLRPTMIAAAAVAAALSFSCGGGSSPSSSTPPKTLPAASPTPTPASGGGNLTASCTLGNGDPNAECEKKSGQLVDQVMAAIDLVVKQKPQMFDLHEETSPVGGGNYKVLDHNGYLDGVVANLQAAGLCAQRDPDDYNYQRIQVKAENGFSESYDVLTGSGYIWHNGYSYRATCVPAAFPVDRGDAPPPGSGCGQPYPAPIHHFNSKVHIPGGEYDILDSTAIVGPDVGYCAQIGYTDGRSYCPVRKEGSPERTPCETWRVGYAKDTGRPGPTWTLNGHYCTGKDSGCENYDDNQYELKAYVGGTYVMCGQNGACGSVVVDR